MIRKFYMAALLSMLATTALMSQGINYEQRYDLLVSKLGLAGVGVETVLDNWEKTDSTSVKLLTARFDYHFTKAQTTEIVKKSQNRYLGMKPLLSLKDSAGVDVHYYQETFFDDEIYGKALKAADRAINFHPDNLAFRFMKANAYISYEKESPDMALANLVALIDENASRSKPWIFEGKEAEEGFFEDAVQEYCYSFYAIGSPKAMEAFLKLSEKMIRLYPDNHGFMNNIGSYHLVVKQDYKAALKFYGKVLKKHPDDYTAIRNSLLAARKMHDVKLEKKYLVMLAQYGPEDEKKQATARLAAMDKK